jgi:LPS export ABC transporter protein LptC
MINGLSNGSMNKQNLGNNIKTFARTLLPGILFLMMFLTSCQNDQQEIDALTAKNSRQEDKASDVTIIYSERGKVKARLFAKEFVRNEIAKPPYTDMKKGLRVEFYNDSLQIENTLTARNARYYDAQGNILIRDSIVIINKKGERLNTEELVWNQQIQKFYTEKFVRITTATQVMYGDGLEANQDFSWYQIKNLKGMVRVNKDQMPQ